MPKLCEPVSKLKFSIYFSALYQSARVNCAANFSMLCQSTLGLSGAGRLGLTDYS